MTYRGALIGCGHVSYRQLRAWSLIPAVEIVAVCDLDEAKAQQRAQEYGIPAVYTDYRRMLDEADLDFVDIATRPATHGELVTAAADRGLDVLCQKPMAESLPEASRMAAACRAAGVTFMVNENARHQAWFRKIKSLLDAGVLGSPYYARFEDRMRGSLPVARFEEQPYFQQMPRLVVYEMGVHYLDVARYLFGEAATVYAHMRRISPQIAGEDVAQLLVTFSHIICLVDMSWCSVSEPGPKVAWGPVRVEGTEGAAGLGRDGVLTLYTDQGSTTWTFAEDTIAQSFVATQQHFVECLEANREPETSGDRSLQTMELVFAAYHSAETGRVVHVG